MEAGWITEPPGRDDEKKNPYPGRTSNPGLPGRSRALCSYGVVCNVGTKSCNYAELTHLWHCNAISLIAQYNMVSTCLRDPCRGFYEVCAERVMAIIRKGEKRRREDLLLFGLAVTAKACIYQGLTRVIVLLEPRFAM
jgi:hypothetical protein